MGQVRELGKNEAEEVIHTYHNLMENGERRYRLMGKDGSGYIRTVTAEEEGWQNSHFHESVREMYIVQTGCILFAELTDDEQLKLDFYGPGKFFVTEPYVAHNVYVYPHTEFHTVKFGDIVSGDWSASPKLDNLTRDNNSEDMCRKIEEGRKKFK